MHPGLGDVMSRQIDDGWQVRRTDLDFLISSAVRIREDADQKMLINSAPAWRTRSRREQAMATSVDLGKVLDRAYEDKTLQEILDSPPSALAGLTERHNQVLSEIFGIQTVAELGSNSTSVSLGRSSHSPISSNPVAFRYCIHTHRVLDIAYDADP